MTNRVPPQYDEPNAIQILVVEDERVVARDIKACLENLGYIVPAIASSGIEAIEQAQALHPDVVLMDIRLKGEIDGIQAAQHIWQELHIPVIYSTGHSDRATVERAMATDPLGYILKPIKEQDLYVTLKTALKRYQSEAKTPVPPLTTSPPMLPAEPFDLPDGPLPLSSKFYLERFPIEVQVYAEISKPGSLVRIKAPRKMGKSSLLLRIRQHATTLGYPSIAINLQEPDATCFDNLDQFLRWFCTRVAHQLQLQPQLDDVWDQILGSKLSCTSYFEHYLLAQLHQPVVLLLDEINYVFKYPAIAQEFLALLRIWYEKAKYMPIWQKLRLVILHSAEIHIPLNIKQSPFNVGLPLKLPEFTSEQIQELAQRYHLNWHDGSAVAALMQLVGGHPYLVHLALYHLAQAPLTLEQLLQAAPTPSGIYHDHLQSYWLCLQEQPELIAALRQLIEGEENHCLAPALMHQLDSMGLVKLQGERYQFSCELYRLYFKGKNLGEGASNADRIGQLEEENQRLQGLVNIDALTQIANRRYFDQYLQTEWRRMLRDQSPLSLILCDIDHFKLYNDTWGHQSGDDCLRQVAQAIQRVLKRPSDLVARYGGEEFAVVLPQTNATGAIQIGENIRLAVKEIALPFTVAGYLGLCPSVTISLGVATTMPHANRSVYDLIFAADKALYKSKQQGRDRTTLSSTLNFRI